MKLSEAQKLIVQLCGHQINQRWFVSELTEHEVVSKQKEARQLLRSLLMEDFGDDTLKWHRALKQRGLYGKNYWEERFDRIVEDLVTDQ
ncbi:hypothetical protein [Pseudophaeobacter sp.]